MSTRAILFGFAVMFTVASVVGMLYDHGVFPRGWGSPWPIVAGGTIAAALAAWKSEPR